MGRPLGPLRGRTEQANALATWLRKVTAGVTVRQLERDFPASKALWSQYRCGSSLIPEALLEAVLVRYVREPVLRARLLEEGRGLLHAAQRAVEDPPSAPVVRPRSMDAVAEAFLRLDEARLRQIDAVQKLAVSEQRCQQLQNMVSALQDRCVRLESERDRAREDIRAELQEELALALEYRRQADEHLEHARRARDEAYALRLATEAQVTQEQIRVGQQIEKIQPSESASQSDEPWFPPLEQVAEVLQIAGQQLDEQDRDLDSLRESKPVSGRAPPSSALVPRSRKTPHCRKMSTSPDRTTRTTLRPAIQCRT